MKRKHFLTSLKKTWIPTEQPGNDVVRTTTVPQIDGHVDMSIVYRNGNLVSTASQEEEQFPNGVDGAAAGEAITNLRQALGNMKQEMEELNSTIVEMREVEEKNQGKIPDINRIIEEVLTQYSKGEDES